MRSSVVTRALVSVTVAVAIAVVGASASLAAPVSKPASQPAASAETVTPMAVVNLGLTEAQARTVQCWLHNHWGYRGAFDGLLGTESWKAMQRFLWFNWATPARSTASSASARCRRCSAS